MKSAKHDINAKAFYAVHCVDIDFFFSCCAHHFVFVCLHIKMIRVKHTKLSH